MLAQGVVAESTLLLDRLQEVVKEFHRHGLYLFTYGEVNNVLENYNAQKSYGLDGIILDDVARMAKVDFKTSQSIFGSFRCTTYCLFMQGKMIRFCCVTQAAAQSLQTCMMETQILPMIGNYQAASKKGV